MAQYFDDHPPSLPRVSVPRIVVPSAVSELSSSSLESMAEHFAYLDEPLLPTVYPPARPLSPHLTAIDIAVPEMVLSIPPVDTPSAESLMMEVCGPWRRTIQMDEGRKGFACPVQKLAEQLQESRSSNHARHQPLQVMAMEHQHHLHESFERAADQCCNQLVDSESLARRVSNVCGMNYASATRMTIAQVLHRTIIRYNRCLRLR